MISHHMIGQITFRTVLEDDRSFLIGLYRSTREDVLRHGGQMTPQQKEDFIISQFDLQDHHYKEYYPSSVYQIIQLDAIDIGRLYQAEYDSTLEVLDITLAPEYRGRGLGHEVMTSLMEKARQKVLEVKLYVQKNNRAINFYNRLGFAITDHNDSIHYQMTYRANRSKQLIQLSN